MSGTPHSNTFNAKEDVPETTNITWKTLDANHMLCRNKKDSVTNANKFNKITKNYFFSFHLKKQTTLMDLSQMIAIFVTCNKQMLTKKIESTQMSSSIRNHLINGAKSFGVL